MEISDSSLKFDKNEKVELYARAGIPEYWILNLPKRGLEVRRDPFENSYRSVILLGESEAVSPWFAPECKI